MRTAPARAAGVFPPALAVAALAWGALALLPGAARAADLDDPAAWKPAQQELARLGDGFVVWESNRSGAWRIWFQKLDASGLRQLSPDEKDRDHFCPHLSPDGRKLAYLSYPRGTTGYGPLPKGAKAPLMLLELAAGGPPRAIAPDATAYGEDRAVVWINDHDLIHLDTAGMTHRLDIAGGKSTPLLAKPYSGGDKADQRLAVSGWLIDPTLRFAVLGLPAFSPYDPAGRTVTPRPMVAPDGCQPYFMRDGQWAYHMGWSDGPVVRRYNLLTGRGGTLIERRDRRLPRERNYVYFPMASACGRLLAFAASPNDHDHFEADYDLFIGRLDARGMELVGKPVRYTFDKGVDRFPDVFLSPPELGWHRGPAPLTVKLTIPVSAGAATSAPDEAGAGSDWSWTLGDGATAAGLSASHTYDKPGEYPVLARAGGKLLRAWVQVDRPDGAATSGTGDPPAATQRSPAGGPIPRWSVEAELTARSVVPTPRQILPYRQGLVVYEYKVLAASAEAGSPAARLPRGTVRVTHWAVREGKPTAIADRHVGQKLKLVLEPAADHPEAEHLYTADTLEEDEAIPRYWEAG